MTLPSWTPAPGYTDLSLKQIRDEFGCTPIVPTPEIPIPRPPLSQDISLPLPVRVGSFTVTGNLDETTNRVGTITFTLTNRANLTVYAKIYHITTNDDDFVGSIKWTITADSGTLTFTIKTDNKTEPLPEQFQVAFTVDEDDFDTAFFVSNPISILDTSKFTIWNPGFTPQVNQEGVYINTIGAGSAGNLSVINAKPSSTFTGTVKYEGSGNPFTPNPKTITTKTVAADGTATVDSFYNIAGKYTYNILYDNFAPDTLYEGTGRSFIAEVRPNLGTWRVSAFSTKVEGGNSLKFGWQVSQSGSSLTQLSWYIVNPGTKVTYTGNGIPNTGTAYSINRDVSTFYGEFTIPTSIVTTEQKFELMLFSGEIVNSSDLARSQEITIQPKPNIPDLAVYGDKVVIYPKTVEWIVEGSIGEKVEYAYIDKNKSNPNYNIYFDYNPDVAAQFLINNYGKPDQFSFAQWHYDNEGKKEGRKSPDELKAINNSISGDTITLAPQGTGVINGRSILQVQQGRQLLPRTSPYVFAFKGEKALNTQVNPIEYSLTVGYKPMLSVVRDSNKIPYGSPVDPRIFGPFFANVSFTGPTNGYVQLNSAGSGSVDLRQGTNLTVNTHTWTFTSNIEVSNNGVQWSAIVENFLLGIKTKTTAKVPAYAVVGTGNSFTITLVRDYQGLISQISNPEIVFSGYPTGTATLSASFSSAKAKNPDYVMTFAENGEAPMPGYLKLGSARDAGTVVFTLTSPTSINPVTITVITVTHDEQVLFGFTGIPDKASPFTTNIPDKWNYLLTGGVPSTKFSISWTHDPNGAAGQPGIQQPSPTTPVVGTFDTVGNYRQDGQNITVAGAYNYKITCDATGKVLTPKVIVNNYDFTVTFLEQKISGVSTFRFYDPTQPIMVRITSFPGDRITIGRPQWKTARVVSTWAPTASSRVPLGWRFFDTPEGVDPNELEIAYPVTQSGWSPTSYYLELYPDVAKNSMFSGQPEAHFKEYGFYEARIWPQYSGFSTREVIIPDSGYIEVNINGSNEKSVTVQSTHFNMVSPAQWGILDSYVLVGGVRTRPSSFGRGQTIVVLNPASLAVESQDTYDTWGDPNGQGSLFVNKINSIETGKLVVITSYDAINLTGPMYIALNTKLGTNFTNGFGGQGIGYTRVHMIVIGYAGQPQKLLKQILTSATTAQTVTVFPEGVTGGQGFPYLSRYNKFSYVERSGSTSSSVSIYSNYDYKVTVFKQIWSVNYYSYNMSFVSSKLGTSKTSYFFIQKLPYSAIDGVLANPCIKTGPPETICPEPVPSLQIGQGLSEGDSAGDVSDIRLKSNIQRIDTHPLGFGIYEYDIFDRREQGVLAQEVQRVLPGAVTCSPDGYFRVNYRKLGIQRKIISII